MLKRLTAKPPGRFDILKGASSPQVGYAVAVLTTLFSLLLKLAIGPLTDPPPFILFFFAVMFSSWYGGLGPGLLATLLSTLADVYFFFTPQQSFAITGSDILMLCLFVIEAVMISSLSEMRRSAQQKAEEANRLKSQILAIVSHDLRSSLNAIIGYSSLLKSQLFSDDVAKRGEMLERVDQNARTLLDLINNILDLSRIEAGRMELQRERVDLSEMIREVLNSLEPLGKEKGLEIILIDDPTVPLIGSDRGKVKQMITNLIANAIKFTDRGSVRVHLLHEPARKRVVVEISDTGIGISEEDLLHIFEPFYQALNSKKESGSGTGLGLSIVKKLVDLLGGTVQVISKPGVGSTFTVCFPYDLPDRPLSS